MVTFPLTKNLSNVSMETHQSHSDTMATMAILKDCIEKIVGPEFIDKSQILPNSKISEDLKMDRFDISQLREEILLNFGKEFDLFGYFYHLDIDQIIDLTVDDVIQFIHTYRSNFN